jgi:hypothetical protein
MPGPTQPEARTGAWKQQAGHGFRRGQPVYLQSPGRYALATLDTGADGLVGDIRAQQFQLVTNGELDSLSGLIPNSVYSLTAAAGVVEVGTAYPIYKATSTGTALIVSGNIGTTGTDVVLPYTFSVTALAGAVPLGGVTGSLDPSWIPVNPGIAAAVAAHAADFRSHDPYYVRSPEGGGILDIDEGSLVFDVDAITQVIDGAFI